jgi:aminopeptidase N
LRICWIVFCWVAIVRLDAAAPVRPYSAENYDVSIRADLAKQRLYGEVAIRLHNHTDTDMSAVELDAGSLQVTSVVEGQAPQEFERDHSMLFVVMAKPLRPDEPRTITIRYEAGPAPGLKFFPDQIYTTIPSDWMPCNNVPSERATLHLTLAGPPDTKAAGSGQLTAARADGGQSITEWRLDTPTEPSWFGFALGAFTENTSNADGVKLRVLGAGAQILDPTAAAMRFFAERTGKHYPGQTYTQVFVHGDATRSMAAGLTLLPDSYPQELAKQPENLWPLASALAHQWYGVGITTKDWSDLWLTEGISAFLADAFLAQRSGKEAYDREIDRTKQIYNQLRAEGKDRPLSDGGWTTRQDADGEIPIHKGARFLFLEVALMGDAAFWEGLRLYTTDHWGQAVTSEDLQKAFDAEDAGKPPGASKKGGGSKRKNSVKPVDNLFDLWVYGIPNASKSKK